MNKISERLIQSKYRILDFCEQTQLRHANKSQLPSDLRSFKHIQKTTPKSSSDNDVVDRVSCSLSYNQTQLTFWETLFSKVVPPVAKQ